MSEEAAQRDISALAKGGRTNVAGFVIRLFARIPFLIIASRFYGAEAMGRFASALVMVEFAALLCTLGQKRGLAKRLTELQGGTIGVSSKPGEGATFWVELPTA